MSDATVINDRLELFVDRSLIERLDQAELRLHEPRPMPLAQQSLPVSYGTVIYTGDRYQAWYRDCHPAYDGERYDGHPGELTCYAESSDGHEWHFPQLDICESRGPHGANVLLDQDEDCRCHNFSPMLDTHPETPDEHRYKALAGVMRGGGLYAYSSPDGIHWQRLQDEPVMSSESYGYDSQNISFWSTVEGCYVSYYRMKRTPHGNLRSITRAVSDDFLTWTDHVDTNPNLPGEHLYTSNTHPYFRAPHIYLALPTRFMPDRECSTDVLFMAARAGSTTYDRLFTHAFIRPGLDPARWGNRSNYVALNVVPTGPAEMSIYHKDQHRYVLRTDGFVSAWAGSQPGELVTKPVQFRGDALEVNASTSAAGCLQVELQQPDGTPLPGFELAKSERFVGDQIDHRVVWEDDPDLSELAGQPIRLRFVMTETDLYSYRFRRG